MLQALQIEAERPTVDVRRWSQPGYYVVKLYDDFNSVLRAAAAVTKVPVAKVRLYYFAGPVVLADRIPISDAAALRSFVAAKTELWVFEDGPPSPTAPPAEEPLAAAPAPSVHSARSATLQRMFRDAVLRRDGGACVLCNKADTVGTKSNLEAAHVVAARSPSAVLDGAELYNVYDTNNGITLCTDCHYWFDRHLWCVRADGTACVASALQVRGGCERWPALHSRMVRVPTDPRIFTLWPPRHYWEVQERLFEAAKAARHAYAAGRAFLCDLCDARCISARGLAQHSCEVGRHMFTPRYQRAFPDAAASSAAAGDGRVLNFTTEAEDEGGS